MNLSLRQLKGFLSVAATSSFTKTSQRMHLSQAALSTMIRELESQLGCRLFHRSTRTVELTDAGRRFVPVAQRVVESLESAAKDLAQLGRQEGTLLHIGVTPTVAHSLLPIVLNRFREQLPHVTVHAEDFSPSELVRLTETGQLDAGYGALFARASGVERHPLFASRLQLVGARKGRRMPPATVPWQSLEGAALIVLPQGTPIQELTDGQMTKFGITPASRIPVNQMETMIAFAESGLGVGVIPSFAQAACRRYEVEVTTLAPTIEFHYHRITRAGHHVPATVDVFTRLMAEVALAHEVPSAA
jgi:DNA-binding transcriptional LysR family regulator